MSAFRSKGFFGVLTVLSAGILVLSSCASTGPVAAMAAAQAVTVAPVTTAAAGTSAVATVAPAAAAATAPAAGTAAAGTPAAGSATTAAATTAPVRAAVATDTSHTLTVVGHGEVKGKPDIATSSMGIEVMAPTVAEAMKQARANMDAVLKALKAAGVADKDIQTSNFSINFERQQPGPVPLPASPTASVTGTQTTVNGVYRVNNMVNVTIRDLDKVGPIVDAAVSAGANNIWGINFGLEDPKALESEARQKAVTDAKARAQSLAELNGVTVGGVVAISEVVGQQPGVRYAAAQPAMGMGGGGTPVEPGEVSFSTDIQVVYAIQ